jgi:SAM-dependent methyltransferase
VRLGVLKQLLAHPLTAGCDLDDPQTTSQRKRIIVEKRFLRQIYEEWYEEIDAALVGIQPPILELGSGGGFFRDGRHGVLASDVLPVHGLDLAADAGRLPFRDAALGAIVMVNVLHHLPDPSAFFGDAARAVRPGGRLVLIEPWVTPWSRFVYRRLHHEPFDMHAGAWSIPSAGPLSGANSAMPWIIFARDRARFEAEFPAWKIVSIDAGMPFRYLLSGGVSLRSLAPAGTYRFWRWVERRLARWSAHLAMFARIVLVRRPVGAA